MNKLIHLKYIYHAYKVCIYFVMNTLLLPLETIRMIFSDKYKILLITSLSSNC